MTASNDTSSNIPEPSNRVVCIDTTVTYGIVIVRVKSRSIQIVTNDAVDIHAVAGITGIIADEERVVGVLASDGKVIVFGPVPATVELGQKVDTKLVSSVLGQLVKALVADPVVVTATRVAETDLELFPRTIEEHRAADVLLDQNAVHSRCVSPCTIGLFNCR